MTPADITIHRLSGTGTEAVRSLATLTRGEGYILVATGDARIIASNEDLHRLLRFAADRKAAFAFADRIGHPVIDWSDGGALRDDFDTGPLLAINRRMLGEAIEEIPDGLKAAGIYALRLALSRRGPVAHLAEPVYETRAALSNQFDYVDPRNRASQIEMERVATDHLRATGAWLPPARPATDISAGEFPVEASVIIPVRNRAATVIDAVDSALSQVTGFGFNVIVVDNHSTDGTTALLATRAAADPRLIHIVPESTGLGIGGCWNLAIDRKECGRFAVQLDSDDLYASDEVLQRIVDTFRSRQAAMVIGSYTLTDFSLKPIPPGIIDHREWTDTNGPNNALRINGLGAPRAFFTPVARQLRFPDVSYGEDYSMALRISRSHRIARIFDSLYLCRRWEGNSDASLPQERINANNAYKDSLRTAEIACRKPLAAKVGLLLESEAPDTPQPLTRTIAAGGVEMTLVHNPARMRSTTARTDAASIAARPCFLCAENRPAGQMSLIWRGYEVLVNPYPIFPGHLTIVSRSHEPQTISGRLTDMQSLARELPDYTVFFNGARCGASAPDHMHFQAVPSRYVPLWRNLGRWPGKPADTTADGEDVNILCRADGDSVVTAVFRRACHRPACYGESGVLLSPAALDLAGAVVLPRRSDFDSLTSDQLSQIITEVIR